MRRRRQAHYVLRVESLFGGPRAKSSVDMLLNAILRGEPARPFSDRVVSPSYVEDVAGATARLLELRPAPGLYHCVNSGLATWLELTQELARLANRPDAPIAPIRMAEARLRPPRPRFAALSNAKLTRCGDSNAGLAGCAGAVYGKGDGTARRADGPRAPA